MAYNKKNRQEQKQDHCTFRAEGCHIGRRGWIFQKYTDRARE